MSTAKNSGNCYLCGKTVNKTAMKNHIVKEHSSGGEEECVLLKIEGAYEKNYWLYVDMPKKSTLSSLDGFLRAVWLECCGHMSEFSTGSHRNRTFQVIPKSRKAGSFSMGETFLHEYDMGSTTECLVTFIGSTMRKKQKNAVRLIGRNEPQTYKCNSCEEPAEFICDICMYEIDNPHFCEKCVGEHESECGGAILTIANSPRSGVCAYDGEMDSYVFDPGIFEGRKAK